MIVMDDHIIKQFVIYRNDKSASVRRMFREVPQLKVRPTGALDLCDAI